MAREEQHPNQHQVLKRSQLLQIIAHQVVAVATQGGVAQRSNLRLKKMLSQQFVMKKVVKWMMERVWKSLLGMAVEG